MGETDGEADGVFEHPAVISATAATKQTRRICVYYTARNVGVPLRGRLGDVWDVSKRPESPLKRPAWPAWLECNDKDVRPWRQLHLHARGDAGAWRSLARGAGDAHGEARTSARARVQARNAPGDGLEKNLHVAERNAGEAVSAPRHSCAGGQ